MGTLVISLDFELFWGVADSKSITGYRRNIEGEWAAIPRILDLFRTYEIRATWATVGMIMCDGYEQWREIRPTLLPTYTREECSTYRLGPLASEYPQLFFARPLVSRILDTPGQELATHTYSHFYCDEDGVTPAQFVSDLECAQYVAESFGVRLKSLVLPRNQVNSEFVIASKKAGISVFRGNQQHWLYQNGNKPALGYFGRAVRLLDSWIPISGTHVFDPKYLDGVTNVPASAFLRPWIPQLAVAEDLRLSRIKGIMTDAAVNNKIVHIWWHPHNFGVNIDENIRFLEALLRHFRELRDRFGMNCAEMGAFER